MKHANPDTERIVIGALLDAESPVMRSAVQSLLGSTELAPEDFTVATGRAWFGIIRQLAERNRPVDANTVWSVGRGLPGVPENGLERLQQLQGANACNRAAFTTHAQELRRLTKLRALEGFFREQLAAVDVAEADPAVLAARLDTFSRKFTGTEETFASGLDDLREISEEWNASIEGVRKSYLPTGIDVLDEAMKGWEENLNVVGGPPSIGKSAMLGTAIYNALKAGNRICLFGLEDGTKWLARRQISERTGLPVKSVGTERVSADMWERIGEEFSTVGRNLENLISWKRGGLGTGRLVQLTKKAIHELGARAVFVDHGLEVQHEGLNKGDDMRLRVQNTFAQLRDLAVATHTPIVVVVHFNREQGKAGEIPPTMHQFAECAGIERMARLAIGLWEREKDRREFLRAVVLKQTNGERDVHLKIPRLLEHALVRSNGGYRYDPNEERKAEAEAQQAGRQTKSYRKPFTSPEADQ